MAQGTVYTGKLNQAHQGGATGELDQHLEVYLNVLDTKFEKTQQFKAWSSQRSTGGSSNVVRIDRMGSSKVMGRKSGEEIKSQRIASDKFNVVVDSMLYIRQPFEYMDNWTNPDRIAEIGKNNGTEFAIIHDEAHVIQLQKARDWVAPAHLKSAFNDGMFVTVKVKKDAVAIADIEANATATVVAHAKGIETFRKRRTPMGNLITICTPERFTELTNHGKLLNKDYVADNGDFAGRRVVKVNGVDIVEIDTFPQAIGKREGLDDPTNGNNFDVTAEDLKCQMITFDKTLSLMTVTAKELWSKYWDDHQNASMVLDAFAMYTVAIRRADTVCVLKYEETV